MLYEVITRQRRAHLPGLHADDVETLVLQTEEQMLAERARFKADTLDRMGECVQACRDVFNLARQFALRITSYNVCYTKLLRR